MNHHIYYSEKDSLDYLNSMPKKDLSFGEYSYIRYGIGSIVGLLIMLLLGNILQ